MTDLEYRELLSRFAEEFLDYSNCSCDKVYPISEFNAILAKNTPYEIICKISCGNYVAGADYFRLDGYDNIVSVFNPISWYEDTINKEEFIEWLEDVCYI